MFLSSSFFFFFFNDTATTEIYTLSLHDALPIFGIKGNCSFTSNRHLSNLGNCITSCRSQSRTWWLPYSNDWHITSLVHAINTRFSQVIFVTQGGILDLNFCHIYDCNCISFCLYFVFEFCK